MGEDASVWFGATLRGDNEWIEIGARTNVQDGSVLHTDMGAPLSVAADVTIGHSVILHGCTIGEGSLVGMGATLLNGAKIGKFCIVGANALVTENKEFPDYSLIVGAPAKVIKQLDNSSAQRLLASAKHSPKTAAAMRPDEEDRLTRGAPALRAGHKKPPRTAGSPGANATPSLCEGRPPRGRAKLKNLPPQGARSERDAELMRGRPPPGGQT